jgi:dihydropyrimidine dehydrogenase (NAD+) subunit PreT
MSATVSTAPVPHPSLAELQGPLAPYEAGVEANRCLYCFDAPCVQACPTHIDIPGFIRKIAEDRPRDAARTILKSNLLGATCSRVCPVQELCEGACVMGTSFRPVAIGRLQRYATDVALADPRPLFAPVPPTGKRVAVVGAGPAGLSCAGELARKGHEVDVFEKRDLPGGLSTYGIVTLREPVAVALAEVKMLQGLGVRVHTGRELGVNLTWADLEDRYDAVFLGLGLGKVPALGVPGDSAVVDGLALVEAAKLDPACRVGRRVAVVGAGNTAIDCASVAKRLGADEVTIVYRRTAAEMTAYEHEYEFAKAEGIGFRFLTQPVEVLVEAGAVKGLRCQVMELGEPDASGRPKPRPVPGKEVVLDVDMVVSAIGQEKPSGPAVAGLGFDRGYVAVGYDLQTSRAKVFAGGDAVRSSGAASTVMAVQDGKMAARSIHEFLTKEAVHG